MDFDNERLFDCGRICSTGNNDVLYDFGMDSFTGMGANHIMLKGCTSLDECLSLRRMLFQRKSGFASKTSSCMFDGWFDDGTAPYHHIAVLRRKELCDGLALDFTITGSCWSRSYGKRSQKTTSVIKTQENLHFKMMGK